ncbi:unnamed protein product [Rotaria sordida]|uniref:VCBS repeat-containing protein n=2 Tax=Rotaria sordida TaxID=392033 RepID=A0A814RW74_9BILA|nr:unnamed protein product [Rotaria sordida]CAF1139758.1 unnamed protein product [Rotaria sordida]
MISQAAGTGPMAVKAADFNNDNFLDLAVANREGGTTSILLGYGDGGFKQHGSLSSEPNAGTNGIDIGDVNKDNKLDIVVVNRNDGNVGVFLGQGNGSFSEQETFSTGNGSSPAGLALNDLNNDNILDLVVTSHENGLLLVFLGTGNGTFTKTLELSTGSNSGPYLIVINDFNKDNRRDIAVGNGDGNYVGIFLGDGTGKFSAQTIYSIESGPYALVTADFNRDGLLDIVTANYYGNNTSILLGNIDGAFGRKKSFSTGSGSLPYAIVNGDFNGDNIQDLIVSNSGTDNVGILLGYGNGKFRKQKTYSTGTGSGPVDVTTGDFNGDNRLDFVSANHNHNTIGIFLNTCS